MMVRILVFLQLVALHTFAQEHASIIKQDVIYTLYANQTAEIEETYTLKIVSEKGKMYADYREFIDKYRKLIDVSIDVYNKNGQKVKRIRKGDGHEFGFSSSFEINDGKLFMLNSDYNDYPYTIEVKSKIKISGFASLPPWVPRPNFNVSVLESNLTVIYPENLLITFKEEHLEGTQTTKDNLIIRSYSVKALPIVANKIRYKDFYKDQPKVLVSPQTFQLDDVKGSNESWATFGEWYLKLNSDPYVLSEDTKNFINSLDMTNKNQVIEKIYEYMQDKTRYVSIQLGIGGFKSLPTADVDKFGYGDCKALSTYTKNMLDYAGIKSNYILVKAGADVPEIMDDFPSNQFNHVFIGIPMTRDTIYLECTSQINPVDYTGTFTDDRHVLWIEKDNSTLIRSKVYSHSDNLKTSKVSMKLDKAGNSSINYSIRNEGIFFDEVMLYKMAPAGYVKKHNEEKFNFDNFKIRDFKYEQAQRNVPEFKSEFKIEVNNFAKLVDGKLILTTQPLSTANTILDTDELMKYFAISRGITLVDEITVSIPENFWMGTLPQPELITSPYGSFETSMEMSNNTLTIQKKLILKKGDYTKENYSAFREFYDQVEKIENRKLILNSKT